MSNRSAVIFDLDGTLTRPYLDFDKIRAEIGVQGPILEALEQMNGDQRERAEHILHHYEWEAARNARLQDGAVEVLDRCRSMGYRIAILTRNEKPKVDYVLQSLGLVVDTVRTREDGAIKPSAQPILSICSELGVEPSQCWMVGDHLLDIQCGKQAGAHTVLLVTDRPVPDFANQADHVITQLTALLPIIEPK